MVHSKPDAAALRKEAGQYLKSLRLAAGLTQRELASKVDMDYYTMISQIEAGAGRVPPDKMLLWAQALAVDPEEFAKRLLRFYDPFMFAMLFPPIH